MVEGKQHDEKVSEVEFSVPKGELRIFLFSVGLNLTIKVYWVGMLFMCFLGRVCGRPSFILWLYLFKAERLTEYCHREPLMIAIGI